LDAGELLAFRSFGEDGQVESGNYATGYLDAGGGLRPELTGRGLGAVFLRQGLNLGSRYYDVHRFRVTIADFNRRALRVCPKVGFASGQHFRRESDNQPFTALTIDIGGW